MITAHINRIATAVPPNDVHQAFIHFAGSLFGEDRRNAVLFRRMAEKSGIEHRWSDFVPDLNYETSGAIDTGGFYKRGAFPTTAARMELFEERAIHLAQAAVEKLLAPAERKEITHLVLTCCTGFSAPGVDLQLIDRCGLPSNIERTMIGFMGCYAAVNALKVAHHIVRSEPRARVLALNIELCTLHLKETGDIEQVLSFLLFGDGCAAALVTAEPQGVALDSFRAVLVPQTADWITWNIGEQGFDMVLSGQVPAGIQMGLAEGRGAILGSTAISDIDLWAVHPGGRTVLDAVEKAFELREENLAPSRDILRRFGNMSSATIMFVLESMLAQARGGERGCGMSFGPGLVAETMRFHMAG
jgi:predicted naringenin-chalcone synthase